MIINNERLIMEENAEFNSLIDDIIAKYSPDKVILFGSRASGDYKKDSDYDVLVLKSNILKKRKLAQELYKLLVGKKISVDFIVDTPENFEKRKDNPYLIFKSISDLGKLLYERK